MALNYHPVFFLGIHKHFQLNITYYNLNHSAVDNVSIFFMSSTKELFFVIKSSTKACCCDMIAEAYVCTFRKSISICKIYFKENNAPLLWL